MARGRVDKKEKKPSDPWRDPPRPRDCDRVGHMYNPGSSFCVRCGWIEYQEGK